MKNITIKMLFIELILVFIIPFQSKANTVNYSDNDTPLSFQIEILPWEIAREIIPKGEKFTVTDVETGLQFKVQRRAGSKHADVQPLTTHDTKIMKKIYNGKWSWKRRAIIVQVEDQLIAASMHGMPHGAGALQNGFAGHFCIHFLGSTTHKSRNMDKNHKLMILKAGGKEQEYLHRIDPYELVHFFETALNYQDHPLLELTITEYTNKSKLLTSLGKFTYFRISSLSYLPVEDLTGQLVLEIPAEVNYHTRKTGKVKKDITFLVRRDSLVDRWKIDTQHFLKELQ